MTQTKLKDLPLIEKAVEVLFQNDIQDPKLLDLRDLQKTLYDFVMIGTCKSEIQMRSVLNKMKRNIKGLDESRLGIEYSTGARWALLDCGDLIIHLFEEKTREFYSLERLWSEAKEIELIKEDYLAEIEEEQEYDEFL